MSDSDSRQFYFKKPSGWSVVVLLMFIAVMTFIESGQLQCSLIKSVVYSLCFYSGLWLGTFRPRAEISDGYFKTFCLFLPGWSFKLSDLNLGDSQYYLSDAAPLKSNYVQPHAVLKTSDKIYILCGDPELLTAVAESLGVTRSMKPLAERKELYRDRLRFFFLSVLQLVAVPAVIVLSVLYFMPQ